MDTSTLVLVSTINDLDIALEVVQGSSVCVGDWEVIHPYLNHEQEDKYFHLITISVVPWTPPETPLNHVAHFQVTNP